MVWVGILSGAGGLLAGLGLGYYLGRRHLTLQVVRAMDRPFPIAPRRPRGKYDDLSGERIVPATPYGDEYFDIGKNGG